MELCEEQVRQVDKATQDVNATKNERTDPSGRSRQRNENSSKSPSRRSHTMGKTQTSETPNPENVRIATDMLRTGIHAHSVESLATLA